MRYPGFPGQRRADYGNITEAAKPGVGLACQTTGTGHTGPRRSAGSGRGHEDVRGDDRGDLGGLPGGADQQPAGRGGHGDDLAPAARPPAAASTSAPCRSATARRAVVRRLWRRPRPGPGRGSPARRGRGSTPPLSPSSASPGIGLPYGEVVGWPSTSSSLRSTVSDITCSHRQASSCTSSQSRPMTWTSRHSASRCLRMTRVASDRPWSLSSRWRSPSTVISPSRSIRATVCDTVGPDWPSRSAILARSGTTPSSSSSKTVRRYISVVSIRSLTPALWRTGAKPVFPAGRPGTQRL